MRMEHTSSSTDSDPIFRLTLRWVLVALVFVLGVGIVGGIVGQWLFRPPLPPLSVAEERLVTTVQEVTISPNTAAAQVVNKVSRSVVLLATRSGTSLQTRGAAVVVTNDGLVATTAHMPESEVVALDDGGSLIALDTVGIDEQYGITYFRMPNSVMVPLDLRRDPLMPGTSLLRVSRSEITRHIKTAPYMVQEFILPDQDFNPGIQRLVLGTPIAAPLFIGAPLVDEEGRLAGITLDATGKILTAQSVEASLQRISNGQRELDPLAIFGVTLQYLFVPAADNSTVSFVPRITSIVPGSPAATAGLLRGDGIVAVNDEAVTWEGNVLQQLSAPLPVRLTVMRGLEKIVVSLNAVTPAP